MKQHFRLISALGILTFLTGNLWAYKDEFEDKKMDGVPHEFKIDGVLFPRFEFADRNQADVLDTPDKTGFQMERVYVNFKGKIKDGFWNGLSYRITQDIGRAADQNSAGVAGTDDNDYIWLLKYAYLNMPLGYGMSLRFGQQHIPFVDGKAGTSLQKSWDHRYIAKTSTEDVRMSASTDQGVSFIAKNPFFGLHLMMGNGEGYHHSNAEDRTTTPRNQLYNARGSDSDALHFLSVGRPNRSNDSYAYDVYGLLSVKPTGENKQVEVNISAPFRFENVTGIHPEEYKYIAVGVTNTEFPERGATWRYVQGDRRAFRDVWYGGELSVKVKTGVAEFTAGGGTVVHHDKRGLAFAIDENTIPLSGGSAVGTNFSQFANLADQVNYDNDVWVSAQYGYVHFKAGQIGGYYRLTTGEGDGRLDRVNRSGSSWLNTYLIADAYTDNGGPLKFGDMNYTQLSTYLSNRRLSLNNQNFMKMEYGLTWHANKRMRVSAGVEETVKTNAVTGYQTKQHPYTNIGTKDAPDTSYISTVESSSAFASRNKVADSSAQLDELLGKGVSDRQIFIRGQFKY